MKKLTIRKRLWALLLISAWLSVPVAASTSLQFTNPMRLPDGQLHVQLMTEVGQSYTIEISTNLQDWIPVDSFGPVTTNLLTLVDPQPVLASVRRFYRVRVGMELMFELTFHHFAHAGNFGGNLTPSVSYPVSIEGYTANFYVSGDTEYPAASAVYFSGPAGSGLVNSAADPENSYFEDSESGYQSVFVGSPSTAPGGEWMVQYKGTNRTFNLPDPQAAARLVVPVPTATVTGETLESVSWVYRVPATGAALSGPPGHLTAIQVQVEGHVGGRLYDSSHDLDPNTTQHSLNSSVDWSNVASIALAYDDDLGNHFVVFFRKP